MDPWLVWPTIILLLVASLATRGAFLIVFPRVDLPPIIRRALRYVPPAVFAAIVVPELFLTGNVFTVQLSNVKLLAGLAAALIAWRTRDAFATIIGGMITLHLVRYFVPS